MARDKHRDPRGLRGGKRAIRPHKRREEGGRRGAALEEARAHQRNIDAAWEESKRIIAEAAAEVRALEENFHRDRTHRTLTPKWVAENKLRELQAQEEAAAKKREQWTLGQARSLIRQGYTVEHVIAVTGWARSWVEDADSIFD